MSYLVLARKFRPGDFLSVCGQEHVTRTLANAIKRKKVSHAFLFAGPRGVGKTSVARILSKALNCEQGPTPNPCLNCTNCREITEGRSLAVREIDGASHNSVDNVRELIETLRSLPAPGSRNKIYIIDEVHMLSTAAFNALLKSLEEPPPNTIFILATTEPHKIPDTVISRCQRHDFRALSSEVISKRLMEIAEVEGIAVEEEVFLMIARMAQGSMRDAQSLLDRVQSFSEEGKITAAEAGKALGGVDRTALLNLSQCVFDRDYRQALTLVSDIFSTGTDPRLFLNDFASHWRDLLLAGFGDANALRSAGIAEDTARDMGKQVSGTGKTDLADLVQIACEGADSALRSVYPVYMLEALVVRMCLREPVRDLGEIARAIRGNLKKSKEQLTGNGGTARPLQDRSYAGDLSKRSSKHEDNANSGLSAPVCRDSELNWKLFVEGTAGSASPMMLEYLRRLSVTEFKPGMLSGMAPKTVVEYLNDEANRDKFSSLLDRFEPCGTWRIKISEAGENKENDNSLFAKDNVRKKTETARVIDDALAHPAVASFIKSFPGSTVDKAELNKIRK